MSKEKKEVILYTDGACSGNPGPGGYSAILKYKGHVKEISGGYKLSTNNRMEIVAIIEGLKLLKFSCIVDLYTDSKLIVDSMNKGWALRWSKNNWKRTKKEKVLNPDLWEKLLYLASKHKVNFNWIRGHSGHIENERCDKLAKKAIENSNLEEDSFYVNNNLASSQG